MSGSERNLPVFRSVGIFFVLFLAVSIFATLILKALGQDANLVSRGGAILAGATGAGFGFFKRHGRTPQGKELVKLVVWSLIVSIVIPLSFAFIILSTSGHSMAQIYELIAKGLNVLPPHIWAILAAVLFPIYLFILWLGYGPLTRVLAERATNNS